MHHLVGDGRQSGRNFEAKRLGDLEIDDELELCGLQHRQIARLGAFQDAGDVDSILVIGVEHACPIAHQTARLGELA